MQDKRKSDYNAHYNPVADQYQSNYAHLSQTADIAIQKNPIPFLENIIWLICRYHDAGKFSVLWQEYFQDNIKNPGSYTGSKEDHATAGGQLVKELFPDTVLSDIIETVIYSHHGLQDCIALEDDISLLKKRREKSAKLPIEECKEQFYKENDKKEIEHRCIAAREEWITLKNKIQNTMKSWEQSELYGNRDFFLGMYERLLLSLLIDADRRNTEDFMSGNDMAPALTDEELRKIWTQCRENVENKIAKIADKNGINTYRNEISEACKNAAELLHNLYQLTVPTGAGKTLSSLRFAVTHAEKFHKKRIIYVAPFNSIVEQNSDEIKKALGMPEIVLEHHCNIIMETDEEQARYGRLTEDWQQPVIVTTAVQFLNTLFAGKMGNVRRMHSLCNSIIIMDEVQALPVKVLELFNMAVNFLTEFVDTTVVLCTATQPSLEALYKNRLRPPKDMITQSEDYREKLRRTEIIDCTTQIPGGMNIGEAAEFILEKAKKYGSVLFIANTKACARNVFQKLKKLCVEEFDIHHLSTNMYPKHRSDTLVAIRKGLETEKIQICISTQLIEAGVDISFRCVIRSLAGLDSIIQSAGRCNRHKEADLGYVYLIKMDMKAENISSLRDIRVSQDAMQTVLMKFKQRPEKLDHRLDSEKAIKMYFRHYFNCYVNQYGNPLQYPVTVKGVPTSIVNLLSDNSSLARSRRQILQQAFKTAGEEFEVIEDTSKISVVVAYEKAVKRKLSELEDIYTSLNKKKQILRELQPYTVSISQTERDKIGQGIYGVWDHRVLVLEDRFYNNKYGITTDPGSLPDLQM